MASLLTIERHHENISKKKLKWLHAQEAAWRWISARHGLRKTKIPWWHPWSQHQEGLHHIWGTPPALLHGATSRLSQMQSSQLNSSQLKQHVLRLKTSWMLEATLILLQVQSSIEPDHIPCETSLGFESLVSICKILLILCQKQQRTRVSHHSRGPPAPKSSKLLKACGHPLTFSHAVSRAHLLIIEGRRLRGIKDPNSSAACRHRPRCTATGNATVVSDHCRLEKPMLHLAGAFKLLNNVSCWGSSSSNSWTMLVAGDHHHHHHQHHHHHHHHQEGETIPNVSKPVAISSTYFKDSSQPDVRTQAAPAAL